MAERSTPAAERYAGATGNKNLLPSRIVAVVLGLMFVGLLVAVGAFVYSKVTAETISGEVVASGVDTDSTTSITVDISRSEPDKEGYCILQAKDYASAEVGRAEVYVPPGKQTTRADVKIDTISRGYVADIYGCQYGKPAYLDPAKGASS